MSETMFFTIMPSPVGRLTLASGDGALARIAFDDGTAPEAGWIRDDARLREARSQLDEYFAGQRRTFTLPLDMRGTPFQLRVWSALLRIAHGATASYGEIAKAIGVPNAARAVGGANHRNPLPIIVPCHRVIGTDGRLVGYGGGEDRKRYLLELERPPSLEAPGRRSGLSDHDVIEGGLAALGGDGHEAAGDSAGR